MPIPEDTVTTSSDPPSPGAPEKRARTDEASAEKQTSRSSGGWEEPHPGQRYSITVMGNARLGATNSNGVGKAGMAAKAYSPYPVRALPAGPRRFAHPRLRTPSTRPTKDPGATRLSLQTTTSATPMLAAPRPAVLARARHNITLHPCAADSMPMDFCASDASSLRFSMTDFSGLLAAGLTTITTASTDAGSFLDLDSEKRQRLPCHDRQDPYGWEAELNKRGVKLPSPSSRGSDDDEEEGMGAAIEFCPVMQFRRAGAAKRTLLQRVLSLGPAREV